MKTAIYLSLAALAVFALGAQAASLTLGDPAPELKTSQWIKGGPVESLDPARTYVVEFWATWCGPCRTTIPHLTEMAKEFPDTAFIGMNVWERGANAAEKVTKFVEDMGAKMDYAVAMDTADQFMAKNWMEAAGQNGIPAAFVVHRGQIVWIGHPMGGLEAALQDIAAGTFDLEKVRQRAKAEQRVEAFFEKAMEGATDEELAEEGQALEALDTELGPLAPGGQKFIAQAAIQQARFGAAMQAYQQALGEEAGEEEIARLEAAARAAAPADVDFDSVNRRMQAHFNRNREQQKIQAVIRQYFAAVGEVGVPEQAAGLAAQIEALDIQDPEVLNNLAWDILTRESIQSRDIPLATRLARKAVAATGEQKGHILDTYARALFDAGNVAEAVAWQRKALAAAPDDEEIAAALKRYEAAAEAAPAAP